MASADNQLPRNTWIEIEMATLFFRPVCCVLAVVALQGCGSTRYVNSSYSFDKVASPTVALFPASYDVSPAASDTVFTIVFDDLGIDFELPSRVRSSIEADSILVGLVDRLTSIHEKEQDLNAFFTPAEIEKIIGATEGATFLYVPAEISVKEGLYGILAGRASYRLYDSADGTLIFEDRVTINVTPTGEIRMGGLSSKMKIEFGDNLLRMKGILNVAGRPDNPAVIHGVQHVMFPVSWLDAWPDEERTTRLVFITQGLDGKVIQDRFDSRYA